MTTLSQFLGSYYNARVLTKTDTAKIVQDLKETMAGNADLKKEAQERLSQLRSVPAEKCFISKIYKDCLQEAFNG